MLLAAIAHLLYQPARLLCLDLFYTLISLHHLDGCVRLGPSSLPSRIPVTHVTSCIDAADMFARLISLFIIALPLPFPLLVFFLAQSKS
jgi:hypothetical protein